MKYRDILKNFNKPKTVNLSIGNEQWDITYSRSEVDILYEYLRRFKEKFREHSISSLRDQDPEIGSIFDNYQLMDSPLDSIVELNREISDSKSYLLKKYGLESEMDDDLLADHAKKLLGLTENLIALRTGYTRLELGFYKAISNEIGSARERNPNFFPFEIMSREELMLEIFTNIFKTKDKASRYFQFLGNAQGSYVEKLASLRSAYEKINSSVPGYKAFKKPDFVDQFSRSVTWATLFREENVYRQHLICNVYKMTDPEPTNLPTKLDK